MPSAYGLAGLLADVPRDHQWLAVNVINACAKRAIDRRMFVEWLDAFLAGWEATKDPVQSAEGALIEWDL